MVFPAAKGQLQKTDHTLPKASLLAPAAVKPHLAPHNWRGSKGGCMAAAGGTGLQQT